MELTPYKKSFPYTKANGQAGIAPLDFVDLPPGTLLFRGVRLPDMTKGDDPRYFYRDFLGDVKGESFCLSPVHNVFTYPFPHIAFGAHTVGERFNAMHVYVLRKPTRVVCMISPTDLFRGTPKQYDGDAPIQRCDKFEFDCKEMTPAEAAKEKEVKTWDNCLYPKFAQKEGVQGWMAIADYDSIEILGERAIPIKNTPMSKYLLERNARSEGKIAELLTWMYTDIRGHRGIPEIALHPWAKHPGEEMIYTDAADEEEAIEAILDNSSKFAFLPLACITANQVLDGVTTNFKATNIGENTTRAASADIRGGIERNMDTFLERLATEGMELPDLGLTKLRFDTRTGFFVLDTFVTKSKQMVSNIPYSSLLLPLETPEQKQFSILYSVLFRSFDPKRFMAYEQIDPAMPPVYRAFIFEHPPELQKMFTNLGKPFPPDWNAPAKVALEEARILGKTNRFTRRAPRGRRSAAPPLPPGFVPPLPKEAPPPLPSGFVPPLPKEPPPRAKSPPPLPPPGDTPKRTGKNMKGGRLTRKQVQKMGPLESTLRSLYKF